MFSPDYEVSVSSLILRLGFWFATTAAFTFVIHIICFVAILLSSPIFTWTTVADYLAYIEACGGPLRPVAQASVLLFSLSFVVLLHAIHDVAGTERAILRRISISFGSLLAVTTAIHYFAQLTAVRRNVLAGQTEGLQHFVKANP